MESLWQVQNNGFLPCRDPVKKLPSAFDGLDSLADQLPALMTAGAVGLETAVKELPELNVEHLAQEDDLERAMMLYSYIGQAYAQLVSSNIPSNIARPWARVAQLVGRPPSLSYSGCVLYNWSRVDATKPLTPENVHLLVRFREDLNEDWFFRIHVAVEAAAADAMRNILLVLNTVGDLNSRDLADQLGAIAGSMQDVISMMDRMREHCSPKEFYNGIRTLLFSDMNVVFEGVEQFGGKSQRLNGASGAQSTIVPCLDTFLGITHEGNELGKLLLGMQEYMPSTHRSFLRSIASHPHSVRDFVLDHAHDIGLSSAYDKCVDQLTRFRKSHLNMAVDYISRHVGTCPFAKGTGGTPFRLYLVSHLTTTRMARIAPCTPSPQ